MVGGGGAASPEKKKPDASGARGIIGGGGKPSGGERFPGGRGSEVARERRKPRAVVTGGLAGSPCVGLGKKKRKLEEQEGLPTVRSASTTKNSSLPKFKKQSTNV